MSIWLVVLSFLWVTETDEMRIVQYVKPFETTQKAGFGAREQCEKAAEKAMEDLAEYLKDGTPGIITAQCKTKVALTSA